MAPWSAWCWPARASASSWSPGCCRSGSGLPCCRPVWCRPPCCRPAVARATHRPAPAPLSFAQKMALARLLEEIPVLQHPDSRQLVIQSLPPHISRMVNPFGPLGLDMFGLIRTGLEYDDGIAALYRVLLLTEGSASRPLRAFRDLAESLGLLTGTEDNR
ncbi:hypothetical protein AB0283_29995 [Micromonospora vinacea]|uniref:effector-associated domain 2-containing protein n=1 Tax=Micromonospora vinacea TaxID=709878 RepID=UPI00344B414C